MTIDDFKKFDFRIGKIISAEPVEGSNKLLKIMVDIGEVSPRQILSGVAQVYTSSGMVGKNVAVITNLESRKMAGVESQGMLLGVEEKESGGPLLIFPNENIPPGAKIS